MKEMDSLKKATLFLENGSVFEGKSFGADYCTNGEVVFNTGMVGYPQSLTDPSYKGQILCFTYPLIGNYGVPAKEKENNLLKEFESEKIQVQGIIVSDYSFEYSHWNSEKSLQEWLQEENIPAITGIDTRALTKELREKGTMLGRIVIEKNEKKENEDKKIELRFEDPNKRNLVAEVSTKEVIEYQAEKERYRIVVVDCGVKNNIIRSLLKRNASVLRVPWNYDFLEKGNEFDAVLFSNGPGDPKIAKESIELMKNVLEKEIPTFGICLGTQIMALAAGADTYKLKYGHRSQNQPCRIVGESKKSKDFLLLQSKNPKDFYCCKVGNFAQNQQILLENKAFITSQNHGFAVKKESLPGDWKEWFVNLNDGTVEGIKHESKPFSAVQFHPEATPGPRDTEFLFDEFLKMVKK